MNNNCPICLNALTSEKINILSCNHIICEDCILKFIEFNNKCPICNKEFYTYISQKDNQEHKLTKDNLINIDKKRKEFELEENFECITLNDIDKQLKYIKSRADNLYIKLFGPRNEKGSDKENEVLNKIYSDINEIKDLTDVDDEIDFKKINKMVDNMIIELKKVEKREYKDFIEIDEGNNGLQFEIEYCTKKHKKKKKK